MTKIKIGDLKGLMTYTEYGLQIQELIRAGSENSLLYSESQLEFTALNQKRMERWNRRFSKHGFADMFSMEASSLIWLVITEGWCGDAAHIIPVIGQLAHDLKVKRLLFVNRDNNLEVMDRFLTNGGRAIPVLLVLSEKGEVLGHWGPRPQELQAYFLDKKSKPDFNYPEVQIGLQSWYNQDKGQSTAKEILQLMESIVK
jgi:hypothetical protein